MWGRTTISKSLISVKAFLARDWALLWRQGLVVHTVDRRSSPPTHDPCLSQGLPVGPPTALVMQLQRVRVFGQHGMVLETSSSMENVPAGDCFTLEDRWVVRPLPASEAPTRTEAALSIETSFEVRFVKSTLFKKIIESRSRADTLEYHRRWFEMIEKHVARRHHERSRTREQARRSSHPLRRTVENNTGRGEKAGVYKEGKGGRTGQEPGGALQKTGVGRGEGALLPPQSARLQSVLHLFKRIKWDRFILAVLVFTLVFYFLRLVLNTMLPVSLRFAPQMGRQVDVPSPLTVEQWRDILSELTALRAEVQEMRLEIRALISKSGPEGR